MRNILSISFILCYLIVSVSCSKDEIKPATVETEVQSSKVLNYIKSLGYSISDIVEEPTRFIVDGDIAFLKNMQVPSRDANEALEEHYYTGQLVNYSLQSNIKIRVDPSLSNMTSEVNSAIAMWNNVGSNMRFIIVTSGWDILITNSNLPSPTCGLGTFPTGGGLPGYLVEIDNSEISGQTYAQKVSLIVHELGHNIGFYHTNEGFGIAVPGWSGSDINSIMNGGKCNKFPTYLSPKDKGALFVLYPTQIPINPSINVSLSQFYVSWGSQLPLLSSPNIIHTGYTLSYGGFSGINFGGTVQLPPNFTTYTIPGVTPYPTQNPNTGGIQVTIVANWSNNTSFGVTLYKNKVNGVWQ